MMTQMIRAAIKNIPHSRICLLGLTVFFFGIIWDMLLYQGFYLSLNLLSLLVLLLFFIQSHIISIKFSEAYKFAEELNKN